MAIFNNDDAKNKSSEITSSTTIITVGSSIKGEINISCNMYIDGEFEGTIKSTNGMTVGKNGKVNGELYGKKIIIQGEVLGSINVDHVEIKSNGVVKGSVTANEFIIEPGGVFEGESKRKSSQPAQIQDEENKENKD